jgi:hypothetical protein
MLRKRLVSGFGLAALLGAQAGLASQNGSFDLSVLVDSVSMAEYPHGDRTYIEAVRGRDFTLRVSNPTSERVAVALSVDGRNVIDAKRTTAQGATKWVLDPGQTMEVPGWQVSGETARRFFFTDVPSSYARWLGDTANIGTIEAVFFHEKVRPRRPVASSPYRSEPQPFDETPGAPAGGPDLDARETRSRADSPKSAQAPVPPSEAGAAVKDGAVRLPEPSGLAATGIGERTSNPIQWVSFDEDPRPIARIALRYEYRRELVRLGVLSSRDDLTARERARGFEPEYAPDPDRHRSQ